MKIILMLIIFISSNLFAIDKNSAFTELKKKYSSPKSIEMDFMQDNSNSIKGKIIATDNNKYRITVPGRIITCDGSSIWNYSYNDDIVIISNFSSHTDNASPERIFFDVLNKYKVKSLSKISSSDNQSLMKLVLIPDTDVIAEMTEINIWFTKEYDIIKAGINSIYGYEIWNISELKLNSKYRESEFKFNIPDGTEVIDLR